MGLALLIAILKTLAVVRQQEIYNQAAPTSSMSIRIVSATTPLVVWWSMSIRQRSQRC